uniref:LRRCT domain-containing protein n=1 Tax=Macrostomum lignano TaxID=282301 RepID=A0A1I8F8A7_9PLAT
MESVGEANDAAVVDKNNAEDEAAQSDAGERRPAPAAVRDDRTVGGRSRDELDFSSQGLTMAPSSLFAKTHITCAEPELATTIRGLPPEISNLTQLRHLDLSRNGLSLRSSEGLHQPAKEMETMAELRELLLSRVQPDAHPPRPSGPSSAWRNSTSAGTKSRHPVGHHEAGAAGSPERHADWDQDSARGEIVCCDALESLLLFGNPIDSLRDSLRELNRLHTLHINYRVFASGVDAETDGMPAEAATHPPSTYRPLCSTFPSCWRWTWRLASERVARSLTRISEASGVLLARHNQLTFVDSLADLTELERIDLGFNCIAKLPDNIGQLTKLTALLLPGNRLGCSLWHGSWVISFKNLDLTGNRLTSIPPEMAGLAGWTERTSLAGCSSEACGWHNNPDRQAAGQGLEHLGSRQDLAHMEKTAARSSAGGRRVTADLPPLLAKLLDPKALHCVVSDIAEYQQIRVRCGHDGGWAGCGAPTSPELGCQLIGH